MNTFVTFLSLLFTAMSQLPSSNNISPTQPMTTWIYQGGLNKGKYVSSDITCDFPSNPIVGGFGSGVDFIPPYPLSPEPISWTATAPRTQNYSYFEVRIGIVLFGPWQTTEKLKLTFNGQTEYLEVVNAAGNIVNQVGTGTSCSWGTPKTTKVINYQYGYLNKEYFNLECQPNPYPYNNPGYTLNFELQAETTYNTFFQSETWAIYNFEVFGFDNGANCLCSQYDATTNLLNCYDCNRWTGILTPPAGAGTAQTCQSCSVSCSTGCINTINECLKCNTGATPPYVRDPTTGDCVQICPNNYGIDLTNFECVQCADPHCVTCNSLFVIGTCTLCDSQTSLYGSPPASPVGVCLELCPEYYAANSLGVCELCPPNCVTCGMPSSAATYCITCDYGYYLDPITYRCVTATACPQNYYANVENGQCTQCVDAGRCQTCSINTKGCDTCLPGYYLYPLGYPYCRTSCPVGWTIDIISNVCDPCDDPNCLTCTTPTVCTLCNTGYYFDYTTQRCVTICPDYWTEDPLTNLCTVCLQQYCMNCDSSTAMCDQCESGYVIDPTGACVLSCPVGYQKNDTGYNCIACNDPNCEYCHKMGDICDNCISNYAIHRTLGYCFDLYACGNNRRMDITVGGTEQCDDGNTNSGDGCSANCEVEPNWYCTGGTELTRDYCYYYPDDVTSPNGEIFWKDYEANQFLIIFNMNINFTGPWADIFYIQMNNEYGVPVFDSWTVDTLKYNSALNSSWFLLTIYFNETFDDLDLYIYVIDRSRLYSAATGKYTSTRSLGMDGISYNYNLQSELDTARTINTVEYGFIVTDICLWFIEFLSGDIESFFSFMDSMQDLAYITFLSLPLPRNDGPLLDNFNLGRYFFLWNVLTYVQIPDHSFNVTPGFRYHRDNSSFMNNIGRIVFFWFLGTIIYLISLTVEKVIKRQIKLFRKISESPGEYFFHLFRTTCLDITVFIVLQFYDPYFDTDVSALDMMLAIGAICALAAAPVLLLKAQLDSSLVINDQIVRNDNFFLNRDFKSWDIFSRFFWIFYVMRRIAFGVIVVTLNNYPTTSIVLLFAIIFTDNMYLWLKRPFRKPAHNFKFIFSRSLVFILYAFGLGVAETNIWKTATASYNVGTVMQVFQLIFVCFHLLLALYYLSEHLPATWAYIKNATFIGQAWEWLLKKLKKKPTDLPKAKISKANFALDNSELEPL